MSQTIRLSQKDHLHNLSVVVLGVANSLSAMENDSELDRIARILADFYRAPLSMSSVQPILDLAVELNPDLKRSKLVESMAMPEPRQPLTNAHTNGRFSCSECGMNDAPCRHYIDQRSSKESAR